MEEDFSLTNDLASQLPEKVEEMKKLLDQEAIANNVYPLDDHLYERFNAAIAGRPDLMGDRKSLTLAHRMEGILENTLLNVKNNSKTIVANVTLSGNDHGRPAYTYNYFGLHRYTVKAPAKISSSSAEIRLEFAYDGGVNPYEAIL